MAAVPDHLLEQMKDLERLFTVDTAKLKKITERFVMELEKGVFPASNRQRLVMSNSHTRSQWRGRYHC